MFLETVDQFAKTSVAKAAYLKRSPGGFFISSMLAGAYVGLGIILIFSVGSNLDPGVRPLAMGASFAIALTLVIFAGSDLFTGHTMFMTIGVLRGKISLRDLGASWAMTWIGNLVGCLILGALFVAGGGGVVLSSQSHLMVNVAVAKMNGTALELFDRQYDDLLDRLVCAAPGHRDLGWDGLEPALGIAR
jgi:nitrite transporter NirC